MIATPHQAPTLVVVNSTISGNAGANGGIEAHGAVVHVTNSTLAGNSGGGGGLRVMDSFQPPVRARDGDARQHDRRREHRFRKLARP